MVHSLRLCACMCTLKVNSSTHWRLGGMFTSHCLAIIIEFADNYLTLWTGIDWLTASFESSRAERLLHNWMLLHVKLLFIEMLQKCWRICNRTLMHSIVDSKSSIMLFTTNEILQKFLEEVGRDIHAALCVTWSYRLVQCDCGFKMHWQSHGSMELWLHRSSSNLHWAI